MVEELKLFGLRNLPGKRIIFLILILIVSKNSYSQNWFWQTPAPTGNTLQSIKFLDSQTGYACGHAGVVLKTTNAGQNWFALATPRQINYNGLDVTPNGTIVAVGDSNTIIRSSDGGANWQTIPSPVVILFARDVDFVDNNTGYIVGGQDAISPQGKIIKTTNGGLNWTTQLIGGGNFYTVRFFNSEYGAAGGQNTFWITKNGGANWIAQSFAFQPFNIINGIAQLDTNVILFSIGYENVVYKTINGGINWQKYELNIPQYQGFGDFAGSMSFVNINTGFMVTDFVGNILKTTNGGINWSQDSAYRLDKWNEIQMRNSDTGYICGTGGSILKTTNGTATWNIQTGTLRGINDNCFINANTGFSAGDSGIILKTTNAGISWIEKPTGTKKPLLSIYFPDANTGYCAGDMGIMFKTTDSGETWMLLNTGTTTRINTVSFLNASTGNAAGDDAMIMRTTNGGTNWSIEYYPVSDDFTEMQFIQGVGYLSGTDRIFKSTNQGANWNEIAFGVTGRGFGIYFTDSLHGTTADGTGALHRTNDGGLNWILQSGNVTRNLRSVYFTDQFNGIAVGDEGVITKTSNGGTNWYRLQNFTTNSLTSVIFIDENTGYVTGMYGTIMKTTNGGLTFINHSETQTPSSFKLYQNYPNPFNPSTTIKYELSVNGNIKLEMYNLEGKKISELVNEKQSPGIYEIIFNASKLATGIYFYSVKIDGKLSAVQRMVLIK